MRPFCVSSTRVSNHAFVKTNVIERTALSQIRSTVWSGYDLRRRCCAVQKPYLPHNPCWSIVATWISQKWHDLFFNS